MRQDGFTLAELMIVIVLLVIALAIAGPPMYSANQRAVEQNAVNEFRSIHDTARRLSRQYGRVVELHLDPGRSQYWIEADTTSAGLPRNRRRPRMFGRALKPGSYFTTDQTLLCYDGRGLPTSEGACGAPDATVVFVLPLRRDSVRLSPMGAILE